MGVTRDMDLTSPNWQGAACEGIDTETFFDGAENAATRSELRKMCASCPLFTQCREWGLKHEVYGFWGGLSAEERKGERRKLGIDIYYITPERLGVAP